MLWWVDWRLWFIWNDEEDLHGEKVSFIYLVVLSKDINCNASAEQSKRCFRALASWDGFRSIDATAPTRSVLMFRRETANI